MCNIGVTPHPCDLAPVMGRTKTKQNKKTEEIRYSRSNERATQNTHPRAVQVSPRPCWAKKQKQKWGSHQSLPPLEGPSTVSWLMVMAWTVVIRPSTIPNLSFSTCQRTRIQKNAAPCNAKPHYFYGNKDKLFPAGYTLIKIYSLWRDHSADFHGWSTCVRCFSSIHPSIDPIITLTSQAEEIRPHSSVASWPHRSHR